MKQARPKSLLSVQPLSPEWLLAWNLKSTSTCGTVEFRRPPQSLSAEDTVHWVDMAVGIVEWALAADFEDEKILGLNGNLSAPSSNSCRCRTPSSTLDTGTETESLSANGILLYVYVHYSILVILKRFA